MAIIGRKFVLGPVGVRLHALAKSRFHFLKSAVRQTHQTRSG